MARLEIADAQAAPLAEPNGTTAGVKPALWQRPVSAVGVPVLALALGGGNPAARADRPALADILVKLSAEIRAQLRLEHDISRTLIDLKVVREFQRTVFEAIQEEAPETARRILEKLKAQRALRRSVELPTLDGAGGFDVA